MRQAVSGLALLALVLGAPAAEARTFRYATSGELLGLDPYINNDGVTNAMKGNLYEGLLGRRLDLSLEPALATEWARVAPDVWRFRLRPGVRFHDGGAFSADDVVASFARITHDQSGMRSAVGGIREVRKNDALAVDLVTKGPDPIADQGLPQFYIMSAAWLEANNTQHVLRGSNAATYANAHANGTGPFRLVSHAPGGQTVLAANADWWGAPAHNLAQAVFRAIPSAQGRVQALVSGEVDMAYPIPAQLTWRLEKAGGRILVAPDLRTIFLGFDTFRDEALDMKGTGLNPLKDRRVREAFRKAIDLDALHRDVMRGLSRPTGSMIAPGIEGYAAEIDRPAVYDPEGAIALMEQAGFGGGFPITLDCPNDRYDNDGSICRRVALMLARINITVKLNVQPRVAYFEKAGAAGGHDTSFFLLGWTPPTFDGLNALTTLMTSSGGGNFGRYSNAKIEVLTRKIASEQDPLRRRRLIQQALTVHAEDVGHIPLHQQMMSWGLAATVADIKARPWNDVDLRWVTMR